MKKFILACVIALVLSPLPASADGYTVGPGDILTVKVYGEEELSKDYEVYSDGTVKLPFIKNIAVGGKTTSEIETSLEEVLGRGYLINPQISVTVKEYVAKKVYVLGQVKNPGCYSLKSKTTLLEAIAMAGGIAAEGDKSFTLVRGGSKLGGEEIEKIFKSDVSRDAVEDFTSSRPEVKVMQIDGYKLLDRGDLSQNLVLEGGDILSVQKMRLVYFDGEIKKPGSVPYEDGLTIMRAISLAGGLTSIASNKVVVTRREGDATKTITVNLRKISLNKSADLVLLPGDIVKVKRSIF